MDISPCRRGCTVPTTGWRSRRAMRLPGVRQVAPPTPGAAAWNKRGGSVASKQTFSGCREGSGGLGTFPQAGDTGKDECKPDKTAGKE